MSRPTVSLVLVTWPNHPRRIEYFKQTIEALKTNLTCTRHNLTWLCCSESEHDPDPDMPWLDGELLHLISLYRIPLYWREGKASLSGAMNDAATIGPPTDYRIIVQDDFTLHEPVDLSDGIDLMEDYPDIDLLRYSWHRDPHNGTEFTPNYYTAGGQVYREVKINGHWPYGDNPHLRRKSFLTKFGPYVEGDSHGSSERLMLDSLVANKAVICTTPVCYFGHSGQVASVPESRDKREHQFTRKDTVG